MSVVENSTELNWTPKRLQAAKRLKSVLAIACHRRQHGLDLDTAAFTWVIARVLLEAPAGPFDLGKRQIAREWRGLTVDSLRARLGRAGISRLDMPDTAMWKIMSAVENETRDDFTALSDEDIGERIQLTAAEREVCRVVLIEACDESRADRIVRQAPGKRIAKTIRQRALRDRKPRVEYLQDRAVNSAKHNRPWEAEGISRASWYRLRGSKNVG